MYIILYAGKFKHGCWLHSFIHLCYHYTPNGPPSTRPPCIIRVFPCCARTPKTIFLKGRGVLPISSSHAKLPKVCDATMNIFLRQTWALIRKNLLIICLRRPVTTFIRALAVPMIIVLILAYMRDLFATPLTYGISSPHDVSARKEEILS